MNQAPSQIHILDTLTANQIAAGEVVERPASVVKELVENAIDAGATRITVRLDQSGANIRVIDNGCGMGPEDLRLAVLRHATSKIQRADDLQRLSTLGFRGEALPSIAAVSRLTIVSKRADADCAWSMSVTDGKATVPAEAAAPNGTTVTVEDLFYNAPARKKFLKTPRTELGLISELIGKLAIGRPDIAFTLVNGNHTLLATAGKGDRGQAIAAVYGKSIYSSLTALPDSDVYGLSGLISLPELTRSNRNGYVFYVNSRLVRSRELSLAVDEAYHTFIPDHRYPLLFLFLTLAPESIDVNVHPGKLEIKLRDPSPVREEICRVIRATLAANALNAPHLSAKTSEPLFGNNPLATDGSQLRPEGSRQKAAEPQQLTGTALYRALYDGTVAKYDLKQKVMDIAEIERILAKDAATENAAAAAPTTPPEPSAFPAPSVITPDPGAQQSLPFFDQKPAEQSERRHYAQMRPLGQFAGTFIVAELAEELYLIDQHAAAERIQYEQLAKMAATDDGRSSEQLAVPLPLSLTYQEHLLLTDYILAIRQAGFIVEYFGDTDYLLRGVPFWLANSPGVDPLQYLHDLIDYLAESGERNAAPSLQLRQEQLFMLACKRAIKANRYLTNPDISALLTQLDQCENSATCPHGRPISCKLTLDDIYKRFLRGGI